MTLQLDSSCIRGDWVFLKLKATFHTRCAVVKSEFSSQVEEGWWSGSSNGKSGVFPSNFVKELDAAGDEQESNNTAADEAGKGVAEPCWQGPCGVFTQRE